MKIRDALSTGANTLKTAGIDDAPLEAEVLLRHAAKLARPNLYANTGNELGDSQLEHFQNLVKRRVSGIPSAYLTGKREFYGRDFSVNPDVLIPRPETELLLETALHICRVKGINRIGDIGTGSGVIAITLALELPQARIYASDVSPAALRTASENCKAYAVEDRVILKTGYLLEPLSAPVDMIIANLPYIRTGELLAVNTYGFEPSLALDGGSDGLDLIRKLFLGLPHKLSPQGYALLEIGQGQAEAVIEIAQASFPAAKISALPDLAGIQRVICVQI